VLFHSDHVFHRSEPNTGPAPRAAFSVFMFPDGARLRRPPFDRGSLVDSLYFPGRGEGDLADTAINPLVWSADQGV
jgi:hypothetical protein